MKLSWIARDQALPPEACWAEGNVAQALKDKVVGSTRNDLRLAQAENVLVVIGFDLPWVDGLIYLGREGELYLPTLWKPEIPQDWLVARLQQLGSGPWAVMKSGKVLELSKARPLTV